VKSLLLWVDGYINAQESPKYPKGIIISTSSATAGMTYPASPWYSISKLAVQKFSEYVDAGVFPLTASSREWMLMGWVRIS
jgi:hypothetical protein